MIRNPWPSIAALVLVSAPACLLAGFGRMARMGAQGAPAPQRQVAVTVDDLPGAEPGTDHAISNLKELQKINRSIPAILKAHHVPAVGFVNEWKLQVDGERDARAGLLEDWLDAGMTLGNHTYAHPDFQTTPLDKFEDETIRGEVVTRALMSAHAQTENYFRHPFLNTGPTAEAKAAFEAFLKARGYEVAPVTFDVADWMFNDIVGDANQRKDKRLAAKTKKEYLEYVEKVFTYFEGISRDLFGREIPQVLLLHDSELNSESLGGVLEILEKRGYKFVSLDAALADPAYSTPDKYIGPEGISWLNRWKISFGQDPDWRHNPDPPKWVEEMSGEIRKAHKK